MLGLGLGLSNITGGIGNIISRLLSALKGKAEYFENNVDSKQILTEFKEEGLLDKASIILTPTAYSNGVIRPAVPEYKVLPTELVTNGTFDTDSNWGKSVGWSIENGRASSDGSSSYSFLQQLNVVANARVYKLSYSVVNYISGAVNVGVGGTTNGNIPRTSVGDFVEYHVSNGTNLTIISQNFIGSIDNVSVKEIQEADFDFTRATIATRVNESGLIEEVAAGVPRIDYSTGVGQWLFEPARTNLVTYSENFSNLYWTKQCDLIGNTLFQPDGTQVGFSIQEKTVNTYQYIYKSNFNVSVGTQYTFSVFVKYIDLRYIQLTVYDGGNYSSACFDLLNKTSTTAQNGGYTSSNARVDDYGDGWLRIQYTFTSPVASTIISICANNTPTAGYVPLYIGNGLKSAIYGAQIEEGSYPTSYIPTSGATVTRNADIANNSGNADLFNDSEGVLYAEVSRLNGDLNPTLIGINKGGSEFSGFSFRTDGKIWAATYNGTSYDNIIQYTPSNFYDTYKIAYKYKTNDFAMWVNGVEIGGSLVNTLTLTGLNDLSFTNGFGTSNFYGKTKELAVFKEALTDEELEALSSWASFELMVADLEYTI